MSLINLYVDKNSTSKDELIQLLRSHNIDFLQHNIENSDTYMSAYGLQTLPALRFEKSITYDVNEESVENMVKMFDNFIETLPSNLIVDDTKAYPKDTLNERNQILMHTLNIVNKEDLRTKFKMLSSKHKK